jgi:aspartate aminotransferase
MLTLVDKGDEVIIPSPYWVSYPEMVNICAGKPRFINTLPSNNFKITVEDLGQYITAKTKLIILNSPSNPTGCVYSQQELSDIAKICVKKRIFILSDEIYEKLIYDNLKHVSIASLGKDIYDLAITVNGLSKSFSMTGWRIGYLGGPQDIVEAISKLQDHSTSNPTSISQKAAVAALQAPDEFSKKICQEFQKRRDYITKRLGSIKSMGYVKPQGAFYVFCDISKTGMNSSGFANRLLDEASVALIPGEGFGKDDYVRISFATGIDQIEKGMDRIVEWLAKL